MHQPNQPYQTQLDERRSAQQSPIEVRSSSIRQTPKSDFGTVLQRGLSKTGSVINQVAATAGYQIPGGAVVGAAISEVGQASDIGQAGGMGTGGSAIALGGSGLASGGGITDAVAKRAQGGDASSQLMMATQQMQEMNQTFNLGYLQLQQSVQNESRKFTVVSNVMKTKHDITRNTLSNLK
jgi:hypothetical protein